jgi:hypothetical protein
MKETGWNDEVEHPEQRGVLSVGRGVWYTTVSWTQPYGIACHEEGKRVSVRFFAQIPHNGGKLLCSTAGFLEELASVAWSSCSSVPFKSALSLLTGKQG